MGRAMSSVAQLALDRQNRLISISGAAQAGSLQAWQQMDFNNLDRSWAQVGPTITQQVTAAQLVLASGSDRYTARVAAQTDGFIADRSAIVPEAFTGVDGAGRNSAGLLYGAVTATKTAVGSGFAADQAMHAGATYLAAVLNTMIADAARNADLVSSSGKGFTSYVRVCSGSACSRCAILSGISSGQDAFARHLGCMCTAVPVMSKGNVPKGVHTDVRSYFDSLTDAEQDKVFTHDGAEAIRAGADPTAVVNARRGARGIGYSTHGDGKTVGIPRGHLVKTTIGYRPNGAPVQVYTTTESATGHGAWGKRNPGRTRLMPESINKIAGNDLKLRQAFLRDAGYIEYLPPHGYDDAGRWMQEIAAQRREDRILVNRATLRYKNFTLG